MAESLGAPADAVEATVDASAGPIFIRKLDRLETTNHSNPNGA